MKIGLIRFICLVVTGFSLFVAASGVASAAAPIRRNLSYQNQNRSYLVTNPGSLSGGLHPLVILLHGGTQSAEKVWKQTSLPTLAQQARMVLAAPDAVDGNWNDGRQVYFGTKKAPTRVDDVGFIMAMIDDLVARDGIDPARIYVTGASNGGMMTYRLVCEQAGRFRAAGALIATLLSDHDCRPAHPVPMMMILGTNDPLVNWDGKPVTVGGRTSEPRLSGPQTADFWASINRCRIPGQSQLLPDRDPKDNSTVEKTVFMNCAAETVLYAIQGGGHTWPKTGNQRFSRLIESYFGPINHDIDASTILIDFFQRH